MACKTLKSICAGVDGYILKKTSPEKLFDAIRDALDGGAHSKKGAQLISGAKNGQY